MNLRTASAKVVMHIALVAYIVFLAFPLLWMFSTSFKPPVELYSHVPTLLPKAPTMSHYVTAFSEQRIALAIWNSVRVGVSATLGVILLAIPAAYALVRYQTSINKLVIGWILTSQLFPVILIMVPLFIVLRNMKLTDSHIGLALVYIVWSLPFVLWMLQGYIRGIPVELEHAAAVDGANRRQIIFRIIMPLLLPGIAASALFAFISAWNEFFFALVLLKSPDLLTLPINLARFVGMEGVARTGPLAAACFIATLPSLVLFGFMQKWLTSGLVAGAVKQ